MSNEHITVSASVVVDLHCRYIFEYISKRWMYSIIPFACCEGGVPPDIDESDTSAYIAVLVRDLSDFNAMFSEIFENVTNCPIEYRFDNSTMMTIRWSGCETGNLNEYCKMKLEDLLKDKLYLLPTGDDNDTNK